MADLRNILDTFNEGVRVRVFVDDASDSVVVLQDIKGQDVDRLIMKRSAFLAVASAVEEN
jgi:hypothetical protein